MTLLDEALAWHAAGASVIPVQADGTKAPAVSWRRYQQTRADTDQLRRWFTHGTSIGLGVICGEVSGHLEMLEIEGRAAEDGLLEQLAAALDDNGFGDLWARLIAGPQETSPAGGFHWFYRVAGQSRPNTKLARRPGADGRPEVLIETRGEGGYVVVAPSAGSVHETGRPWVRLGGDVRDIATLSIDERDALHAICGMFDTMPVAEPVTPRTPSGTSGTRPGDDYNQRASWDQILTPRGWRPVRRFGPTCVGWVRPGKNIGISATTGRNDGDNLYVFTTSTEFESEKPYSKFAAYTLLEHGGDYTAAAKALKAAGYGTQTTRPPLTLVTDTTQPVTVGATALQPHPEPVAERLVETHGATEDGTARALVALHGNDIRYCPQRGRWLSWDGHRWRWDEGEQVRELVRAVARQLPESDGWASYKKRALSAAGVTGILRLAQSDQQVTVHLDRLDSRPYELNTPSGIIDLRTGQLSPPDPAALHTRSTAVAPDFDRKGELFERFLADTFDGDDLTRFVQRLLGLSAIGTVLEQILPFAHGSGQNGKTTLLEAAAAALGQGETGYSIAAPSEMLMLRRHSEHPTEIAQLAGARLVICSELDDGQRFAEARIKQLTGRDSINARFMRRDPFTFTPSHTMWLLGNHKPSTTAGGPAFWRRIKLVPFLNVVPPEKKDGALGEKLEREGPAILAWIARGAADYMAGGLRVPGEVEEATTDYANDQDTVSRFVDEMCHVAPGQSSLRVAMAALRTAYERWCAEVGETPVSAKRLGSELRDRFGVGDTRTNSRKFYTGLGLVSESVTEDGESVTDSGWYR